MTLLGGERGMVLALDPTGGCECAFWEALDTVGFMVRQVSAAHVRHFAQADVKSAKTDLVDPIMIARFMAVKPSAGHALPARKLRILNMLVTKRNQLIIMRKTLSRPMNQRGSTLVDHLDSQLKAFLQAQLSHMDDQIRQTIQ